MSVEVNVSVHLSPAVMSETPETDGPTIVRGTQKGFARRHWLGLSLTTLVVVPIVAFALWVTSTLTYSYSRGERTGYNQKLSKKGWICKTWEGEIAMTAMPGVAPQLFTYSVRSDSVAQEIASLAGKLVTLHYEEHRGVPTSCFGETDYYVVGVEKTGG